MPESPLCYTLSCIFALCMIIVLYKFKKITFAEYTVKYGDL